MEKKNVVLTYEELTKDNVELIKELQHKIFPESSFENGYDLLMEKGPEAVDNLLCTAFVAYADGKPAGIFGLYIPKGVEEHHSIWLGWFGILPDFRGLGIGKKILYYSIEKAKEYKDKFPIKYFRLYTVETVNDTAQPLYNRVMTLKEYYKHEELQHGTIMKKAHEMFPGKTDEEYKEMVEKVYAIFSKSLDEKEILVPWNDYFMNINAHVDLETDYTTSVDNKIFSNRFEG